MSGVQKSNEKILLSTGNPALDDIIQNVIPGDNIVFQVDSIQDYIPFVYDFCLYAEREHKELIYFRFATHKQLVPPGIAVHKVKLHPELGFESFIFEIFKVIEQYRYGACYVFDAISDLAVDWYSDVMVANFFMLTCPYLYDFDTATFFIVFRNRHSHSTLNDIHNTAQIVFDLYHYKNDTYIHPLKVINRHSPNMYLLHRWDGKDFHVVTESYEIAAIITSQHQEWWNLASRFSDVWTDSLINAQQILKDVKAGEIPLEIAEASKQQLLRMMIARDPQRLKLASEYFDLEDLLQIGKRLIGTGLIGGKSVGMLLGQAILRKKSPELTEKLEQHDSFFIGSDVYYTFLVRNNLWWKRRKVTRSESFLEGLDETVAQILHGTFPQNILWQFIQMLNYFGQSPIIVRSSSLLEDNYGNSFAGKYESIFCVNLGTPAQRLSALLTAVRKVYASAINLDALTYRKSRNLLENDEQMAILVQRVSGGKYGNYFFPQVSGVGFSFNPFVWNEKIDPKSGVLRLVLGLGTRAVERTEDDYTHIVALNVPSLQIQSNLSDIRRFSQQKMDILNMSSNLFESRRIRDICTENPKFPIHYFASRDNSLDDGGKISLPLHVFPWVLTFDHLLQKTPFIQDIRRILKILHEAYDYPIDIEFTVNLIRERAYTLNLLQCRPFQVKLETSSNILKDDIPLSNVIVRTTGPILGNSISSRIDLMIYIEPQTYGKLSMQERFAIARLVGKINHHPMFMDKNIMIFGPGRWGTTTPALGIPVTFAEINKVKFIGEIAEMHEGLIPDISLGTHFFNDLVEMDIVYFALYPDRKDHLFNREFFQTTNNILPQIFPEALKYVGVLKVFDFSQIIASVPQDVILYMNTLAQRGEIYIRSKNREKIED